LTGYGIANGKAGLGIRAIYDRTAPLVKHHRNAICASGTQMRFGTLSNGGEPRAKEEIDVRLRP
jgi:hypothetical protein